MCSCLDSVSRGCLGLSKCLGSLQFTLWWISKCHTQVQGKSLNHYALRRDLLNITVSWVQSPGPKCRFNHHQLNPGLSTEVLLIAGAGEKHVSSCLVGGCQGLN